MAARPCAGACQHAVQRRLQTQGPNAPTALVKRGGRARSAPLTLGTAHRSHSKGILFQLKLALVIDRELGKLKIQTILIYLMILMSSNAEYAHLFYFFYNGKCGELFK